MDIISESLAGLGAFLLYFGLSLAFLLLFKVVYIRFTPHDEWKLVKQEQNIAAAIGLAGSIIGYCLAIAGAASNAVNVVDFALWGIVALIAQLLAFYLLRFGFMPKIVERIENNEIPAGIIMAATSVSVGLLNAACMSY